MKSMCQEARRNSPSVAERSPASSCLRTTSRIASSSMPRSSDASMRPSLKSSRACSSCGGGSRLPTWSARNGGRVRAAMAGSSSGSLGSDAPGLLPARAGRRRDLEQVGDHHVLVAEAQVVGVRERLDALDVRLALGEELVEVEEREVDDLRLVAGAGEQLGGPRLAE